MLRIGQLVYFNTYLFISVFIVKLTICRWLVACEYKNGKIALTKQILPMISACWSDVKVMILAYQCVNTRKREQKKKTKEKTPKKKKKNKWFKSNKRKKKTRNKQMIKGKLPQIDTLLNKKMICLGINLVE